MKRGSAGDCVGSARGLTIGESGCAAMRALRDARGSAVGGV